jgi:heme/copper-type cytochrome/quinol oxidase subunit 3
MLKPAARVWALPVCLSLVALAVLAGYHHHAAANAFGDEPSGDSFFFSGIGLHLVCIVVGAILGALVGAFCSPRAKGFRRRLG